MAKIGKRPVPNRLNSQPETSIKSLVFTNNEALSFNQSPPLSCPLKVPNATAARETRKKRVSVPVPIRGGISCYFANARSLTKKMDELRLIAVAEKYDILSIVETWTDFSTRHFQKEFSIENYTLFSRDRIEKIGGGIICYVKKDIPCIVVEASDHDNSKNIEALLLNLFPKTQNSINLTIAYRPPKQREENDTLMYSEISKNIHKNGTVIVGDFNLPKINWNSLTSPNIVGERFLDFMHDSYLTQLVDKPTRNENILDLILTNENDLVNDVTVDCNLGTSDHHSLSFVINRDNKMVETNNKLFPNFKLANFDLLRKTLKQIDWAEIWQTDSSHPNAPIHETWNHFSIRLKQLIQTSGIPFAPKRTNINKTPSWITTEIKQISNRKNKLYKKFQITKNDLDYHHFILEKRNFKSKLRRNRRNYEKYTAKLAKKNPKIFHRYCNFSQRVKQNIGPLVDKDGKQLIDNKEIVVELNNFFASVFIKENNDISYKECLPSDKPNFTEIFINKEITLKYLSKLNIYKSPGPDEMYPRIIKEIKNEIADPLSSFFQKSVDKGTVPFDWKLADVTPIYKKKGKKSNASNYRPISLTSIIGKILETIIRDQIVQFLEINSLIKNSQHGFRNRRSCLTNLLEFFKDVFEHVDAGHPYDVIYFDFKKAFDKVPHRRLLYKLEFLGIRGKALDWIKNWLTDRKQRVVLNGIASDWQPVTSGIPQGSVLGPILFIVYINDLDENIHSNISKFADDTKLGGMVHSQKQIESIQKDINALSKWSEKWLMEFNEDKCSVIHFGKKNPKHNYTLRKTSIKSVEKQRDLGVIISHDLKSKSQVIEAAKKANRMLGMINRSIKYKCKDNIIPLYNSLVRPHLEYCVQFWSPLYNYDRQKLEKIQKRATKMIPEVRHMEYEDRLKHLNLFSLDKRRERGDLIQTFKIIKKLDNVDPSFYFSKNVLNTRNNGYKLAKADFKSSIGGHFFTNRVFDKWNSLPPRAVECDKLELFKKRIDEDRYKNQ